MIKQQHPFWGSLSPLGGLTGAGILIMGSARMAWSITIAGSLVWVYGLTALAFALITKLTEKNKLITRVKLLLFTCLACFFGCVYLLLLWLLCPFAAMEIFFLLMLVPLFCSGAGICERIIAPNETSRPELSVFVSEAVLRAVSLGGLLIVFSIIREPLAYRSLSLPGSSHGMIAINLFKSGSFFNAGIFASTTGALLLLGYFTAIYQYARSKSIHGEI